MDIGTFRGLITAVLLLLFIALCVWAWSRARRHDFDEASMLPLVDEPPAGIPNTKKERLS